MDMARRFLTTRWLVRAPIPLFRAGLGAVFGGRLMMLEHTGRRSGLARSVVLEVVSRPERGRVIVASGLGRRSQWFRNVQAAPTCRVWVGTRRGVRATATVLSPEDGEAVLTGYRREHPRAWARLEATMRSVQGTEELDLPLVRLDLSAG